MTGVSSRSLTYRSESRLSHCCENCVSRGRRELSGPVHQEHFLADTTPLVGDAKIIERKPIATFIETLRARNAILLYHFDINRNDVGGARRSKRGDKRHKFNTLFLPMFSMATSLHAATKR